LKKKDWKEAVVAKSIKTIYLHLPADTAKNHEQYLSEPLL